MTKAEQLASMQKYVDGLENVSDFDLIDEWWNPKSRASVSDEVQKRASRNRMGRRQWIYEVLRKIYEKKVTPIRPHDANQAPIQNINWLRDKK
jgi:hypothetical protein